MCEPKNLDRAITLLYELVTGQLINPGKLDEPVQRASDLYAAAMEKHDDAAKPINALVQTEEDEEALDRLKSSNMDVEILMFEQGYRLGYARYIPDENRYYGDAASFAGKIIGPHYGNAPDALVSKHQALVRCMTELYDINPHDPEIFELTKLSNRIGEQILRYNEDAIEK